MMKQFKKVLSILCAIALLVTSLTFALAEEPAEQPVGQEPVVEEPAVEEPVAEEPVVEEPAVEEPVAEEPVVEEPVAEEPVAEEPVAEEPMVEEPVAEEPAAEEPAVEEPVVEEPASEEKEEVPAEEEAAEEASSEEEASDNIDDEDEEEDDDGLVPLEDNDGYVDQEVIEENTPAITDELKGLREADLFVGQALTDYLRFGDELTVTLKGCNASTVELQLYVPVNADINTKVDGKAVSFTPADCDDPSLNLFTYELTNAAGRNHEIVLNAYGDYPFQLAAVVRQIEEETPVQEDEASVAEEINDTPAEVTVNDTPADDARTEQPEETPAPTIQVSVKTYDALKVGCSISDSLVAGQKARIQVKCGKTPYVSLTLSANPDDVIVTIDGEATEFTAAGNGIYTCDLDEVAFRKFAVVILAKQDLDFTLSASARQVEETPAEEEGSEEIEEVAEESEDLTNKEETAEEATEETNEGIEEVAEEAEEEPSEEVTEEEAETSEEEGEEAEEDETSEEREEAESEEENTEEENEEAAPAYVKVIVTAEDGADLYAEADKETEVIGHLDAGEEALVILNEEGTWAQIYSEDEEAAVQFIFMEDAEIVAAEEAEEEIEEETEEEAEPLTEEQLIELGYRKVQILNKNGANIYAAAEEEAEVIGHADFESELWIRNIEEADGWAEIYTEKDPEAEKEIKQFIKLAEIEKQPLTDEEIEALGYRKIQILNQNGTDIYDSTEEEAAVISHVDFESELWIKDLEEVEGWAEVFSEEGAQQFVKLTEIEKQMPTDEEMLEAGYIKVYVAYNIGANVYADPYAAREGEEEDPIDHLDVGSILWVKLIEGADRALIYDLDEESPAKYISLVDIIATMKPEGMEDLPTRELSVTSNIDGYEFIAAGSKVVFTTELINFLEDDHYTVQWQYSVDDEVFLDIEDANDLEYEFEINMDNANYIWKVSVVLIAEETEE